jgi:hypothetical protein
MQNKQFLEVIVFSWNSYRFHFNNKSMKRLESKTQLNKPDVCLMFLLGIMLVVNLIQAAFTELHFDEAYYWVYSQHLAWGYFDHPPLTAWMIWLGSSLFGGAFGVRFITTLLQPVYLFLFWKLLRPQEATVRMATLYFLLCAAMPVFEAYGFIATPDAPLLFSTVLFLKAYRDFLSKNSWQTACFTGFTIALLIYSKYHGFLVFFLVMLPDIWKLLKNPRFYLIVIVALIALSPHIVWLYDHQFATIRYHLVERGSGVFKPLYIREYIINLILCYHPLLFSIFVVALFRRKSVDGIERRLIFMAVGFYLFFFVSTFRSSTQPQWLLPTALSICFVLFRYLQEKPKTEKVVRITALTTLCLIAGLRVFLMTGDLEHKNIYFFHNEENNTAIAHAAKMHPVVFLNNYAPTSMYLFYTQQSATTQLSIFSRSNQYKFWDFDDRIASSDVLMESKRGSFSIPQKGKKDFKYDVYKNFLPVRRIKAEWIEINNYLEPNAFATVSIKLTNPYQYNIKLGNGDDVAHVHVVFKQGRKMLLDVIPRINDTVLQADSSVVIDFRFKTPNLTGAFDAYICVQQPKLQYDSNNEKPLKIKLSNNTN